MQIFHPDVELLEAFVDFLFAALAELLVLEPPPEELVSLWIEQQMVDLTPLGRLGEVEDIAACALYLASPAASYVTGEIYGVNGGLVGLNMQMPRAFD